MKKENILIGVALGSALSLIGGLLTIIGVFLRWGRLSLISGWDMITTTISGGNLIVFLVLIFGIVGFFGGLVLVSAFIGNWTLAVKRRITYFLILVGFIAAVLCAWYFAEYVSPHPLPYGFIVSWLGAVLLVIGSATDETLLRLPRRAR